MLPVPLAAPAGAILPHHRFDVPDASATWKKFAIHNANSAGLVQLALAEMHLFIDRSGFRSWGVQTTFVAVNISIGYLVHSHMDLGVRR